METMFVRSVDQTLVCVPRELQQLTTYVLLEQEDWFEREIGFVRRYLAPGMHALDIGASYGTYGLAMARAVGPTGRVWCFEPGSATRALLTRSAARNGFGWLTVLGEAVGRDSGRAYLNLQHGSELNRVSAGGGGTSEAVAVTSLDRQQDIERWGAIDFVKLDVEGEELNVLLGGERFFAEQDPLVMFELKHAEQLNMPLIDAFRTRGYAVYRMIGADHVLVPFDPAKPVDTLALNLFACKPTRAVELTEAGLLAEPARNVPQPTAGTGTALIAGQAFAAMFASATARRGADAARYHAALDDYAGWRDDSRPLATRIGMLERAVQTLRALVAEAPSFARTSSLARFAADAGERGASALAAAALLRGEQPFTLDEPFWPPSARFDRIAPGDFVAPWSVAATIECYERERAFSSYFAPESLETLEVVRATPFDCAELERRRQLIRLKAGTQAAPLPTPPLDGSGPDSRNPEFWRGAPIT